MINYFIFRRFRKIIIGVFLAITLTGGSGDMILNYLAESGDIYDYTILKLIYDNKEKIKNALEEISIDDIKYKINQVKEVSKEVKDFSQQIKEKST